MKIRVAIIYPVEPSYIFGLLNGLSKIETLQIIFLGSDRSLSIKGKYLNISFFNIRGSQNPDVSIFSKLFRIIKFYIRLIKFCINDSSRIYHSHFPNKILFIDFVLINLILKLRRKKIIYTAHNIDYNLRDRKQSFYKTLIFRIHYLIVDHIIVHNNHSHKILTDIYPNTKNKVSIVPIGLNVSTIKTGLKKIEARKKLNIDPNLKTLLFFGGINEYKGLEVLLEAYSELLREDPNYLLIIAGTPRDKEYFSNIKHLIESLNLKPHLIEHYEFVPDDEVEKYFVASDCCVLPYKSIFQSGVHVLSYSFGIPVIASDVGSFREEDVIEGVTGFIFKPNDSIDLKLTIKKYFASELFIEGEKSRINIIKWANDNYSWDKIALKTYELYKKIL